MYKNCHNTLEKSTWEVMFLSHDINNNAIKKERFLPFLHCFIPNKSCKDLQNPNENSHTILISVEYIVQKMDLVPRTELPKERERPNKIEGLKCLGK